MLTRVAVAGLTKRFARRVDAPTTFKQLLRKPNLRRARTTVALEDITLNVEAGEILGIVGHNGSGKSTLLKCVAGILTPTEGSVMAAGRVAAMLELGAGFHPELTGRQNVYLNGSILGLSRREIDERFQDIVEFAELEQEIDEPVKHYSSGMYVRLGFAVATRANADVLLVDEVLAVGDPAFQRRCLDRIERFRTAGGAVLFVSHDPNLVHRTCDRVAVLDHGRLVALDRPGPALEELRSRLFDHDDGHGDPFADGPAPRIRSVDLDLAGAAGTLGPGQAMIVQVDLAVPRGVEDLTVGIQVNDASGATVFGTNTDILEADVGAALAQAENGADRLIRFAFRLRSVSLTAGTYSVTVGAHSADSRSVYDWRDHAVRFDVVDRMSHTGVAHLDPEVTVRPLKTR